MKLQFKMPSIQVIKKAMVGIIVTLLAICCENNTQKENIAREQETFNEYLNKRLYQQKAQEESKFLESFNVDAGALWLEKHYQSSIKNLHVIKPTENDDPWEFVKAQTAAELFSHEKRTTVLYIIEGTIYNYYVKKAVILKKVGNSYAIVKERNLPVD